MPRNEVQSTDRLMERLSYTSSLPSSTNRESIEFAKRALKLAIKNELTPRQTQMLMLYYFEGLTMDAIASRLGVNKSTVSRQLATARKRLKHVMQYTPLGQFMGDGQSN